MFAVQSILQQAPHLIMAPFKLNSLTIVCANFMNFVTSLIKMATDKVVVFEDELPSLLHDKSLKLLRLEGL